MADLLPALAPLPEDDDVALRLVPVGPAQELAAQFAGVARALSAEQTVDKTLARLVDVAVDIIPGCHHAGVTVVRRGRPETPAATDEVPAAVDALQYETGQGPCLSAIREHAVYRTGELAADERWPAFAEAAARTGVRSVLAFRLFTDEDTLGALNLYSRDRDAFDDETVPIGTILAAHAALAFDRARDREQISGLEHALNSNRRIAMAIGMLMANHRIKENEAFNLLRMASQRSNRRLRDIADEVVRTGGLRARPTP
ncbi:MAG TPA: GAF and ANTAR domain-containing protein [Actinoplanes sp.]|nr:GAF and ANTAR domain-containing protein [Actinoplanes sp.]